MEALLKWVKGRRNIVDRRYFFLYLNKYINVL